MIALVASLTRGAILVRELMDGHRPAVWIPDSDSARQGYAAEHQTCLARDREVAHVVEASDDPVPRRLRLWLHSVFAFRTRHRSGRLDFAAKRRSPDGLLGTILTTPSCCDQAPDLQAKIGRARDQLLVSLGYPGTTAPTGNGSERQLHPAVVLKTLTNGYRDMRSRRRGRGPHRSRYRTPSGASTSGTILKIVES